MKKMLDLYIKENFEKEEKVKLFNRFNILKSAIFEEEEIECLESSSVKNFIESNKDNNIFKNLLFSYIDNKGLKDSDVYNKVHIDRRLFSKIRNDDNYHPSRDTVILFGFALELNEDEIDGLLQSASYSLSKNNYFDLIIRFCFINKIYNLIEVNELLDSYGCKMFNY